MSPVSAVYRIKIAELSEKGLKGEALANALDKAMDSDVTEKEAGEKEFKVEADEYK